MARPHALQSRPHGNWSLCSPRERRKRQEASGSRPTHCNCLDFWRVMLRCEPREYLVPSREVPRPLFFHRSEVGENKVGYAAGGTSLYRVSPISFPPTPALPYRQNLTTGCILIQQLLTVQGIYNATCTAYGPRQRERRSTLHCELPLEPGRCADEQQHVHG